MVVAVCLCECSSWSSKWVGGCAGFQIAVEVWRKNALNDEKP